MFFLKTGLADGNNVAGANDQMDSEDGDLDVLLLLSLGCQQVELLLVPSGFSSFVVILLVQCDHFLPEELTECFFVVL